MDRNAKSLSSHSAGKATAIVMFALILSKITGQLREMLIPSKIGFGALSDAFILGFLIPDLVFQLLVGGSIQAAITPALSAGIYKSEEKKVWRSVSIFINITASVMLLAVIVGEITIPYLMPMVSGDKSKETVELAISVSRMLFPQVFFMMLAALSIGVLNAYKKFTAASMGPVFYNVCVVTAMVVFGNKTSSGVIKVAAGISLSAVLYFLLQFWFSRKEFSNYRFSFNYKDKHFKKLLNIAIPTLISASIVQINFIVLSAFANLFDDGALTGLRFATTTWQLPYGVFAIAIGGVMLPTLSGHFSTGNFRQYSKVITQSLRSTLFLIIPSALIFAMLSPEIIRGIFQWGESSFTSEGIEMTARMLIWFCISMICHSVIFIFNMSFYSIGKTKIPLYNGIISLISNTLLCFLLIYVAEIGIISMPVAYSLSSLISVFVLGYMFKKSAPKCSPVKIPQYMVKSVFCALMCFLSLLLIQNVGMDSRMKIIQLLILGTKSALAMVVYFATGLMLQMKEPLYVIKKVREYIKK